MTNYYPNRAKYIAIAKEGTRGTENTTPTIYLPVTDDSNLDYKLNLLPDGLNRGIQAQFAPAAGRLDGTGKLAGKVEAGTIGDIIYALLGTQTQTEQSVITISDSNKYLDFNIGGSELTATIATGSYPIGTVQTGAGTLCKAIYDAIVAAEATGTYTVTYSRTTRLFTVTRSAGTLELMWATGTHGSGGTDTHVGTTLGYSDTADDTGALSYAGDSQVTFSMKHAFTRGTDIQLPTYSVHFARGVSTKAYLMSAVKMLTLDMPNDAEMMWDADMLFKSEGTSSASLSPSWSDPVPLVFNQAGITLDAVSNTTDIGNLQLVIDNGSAPLKLLNGSQQCADILALGPLLISGSMIVYFTSETQRAKFLANTAVALEITVTGSLIGGAVYNKLVITLPEIHYNAFDYGNQDGVLAAACTFNAFYKPTSTKAIEIDLYNSNIASY